MPEPVVVTPKPWYKSVTLWTNIGAFVAAAIPLVTAYVGFLDTIETNQVVRFESALLSHVRSDHPELLTTIRDTKALDDETTAQLKTIIGDFAKSFA